MKKALMIIAMVAIVVIAGSMLYYFVFYRPGIAKADLQLQEQKLELEREKQKATELSIQTEESIKQQQLDQAQQEQNKKAELTKIQIVETTTEIQEMTIEYNKLIGVDKQDKAYSLDENNIITGNIKALIVAIIIKNYSDTPIAIRWVHNNLEYFKSSELTHPSGDNYVAAVGASSGILPKGKWQCNVLIKNINQILIDFELK